MLSSLSAYPEGIMLWLLTPPLYFASKNDIVSGYFFYVVGEDFMPLLFFLSLSSSLFIN